MDVYKINETKDTDITTMKIESAPNVTKMYNPAICEELGITILDGYEAIEE